MLGSCFHILFGPLYICSIQDLFGAFMEKGAHIVSILVRSSPHLNINACISHFGMVLHSLFALCFL